MILNFPIRPEGKQLDFFQSDKRYTVVCAGRRFGKTEIAKMRTIVKALSKPDQKIYWLEPVYRQAKRVYQEMVKQYFETIQIKHDSDLTIKFLNNSEVVFRGTDQPHNLRGDLAHHIILDECAIMKENLYFEVVRPMVSTTDGTIDFISTPFGRNWFYDVWNAEGDEYQKIHATSLDNPTFSTDEWFHVKRMTPADVFNQEYMAEFNELNGAVFADFQYSIGGDFEPYYGRPNSYIMSVDLAKMQDFTVIMIWDETRRHLAHMERFNQMDWTTQKRVICDFANQYKVNTIIVDSTGVGSPIYDDLQQSALNCHIIPYHFSYATKNKLIDHLKVCFSRGRINHFNTESALKEGRKPSLLEGGITFPGDDIIVKELKIFSSEQRGSNIHYNAPPGYHDDCVISMGLGVYAMDYMTLASGEL